MASTMAIPQVATLPTFHGPPMAGPMPGTFPPHVPVTVHAPVISGPVMNGNNSAATLNPPNLPTLRLPVVPVGGGCYNDGMEVVWHGEFSRLFSSFFPPHIWYLSITNAAPQEKWKFFRDSAKVRFCCQDCGNGWTSMKGRVTFWFHLNTVSNEGFVQFKLYGQVCKKCNSGKFEYVMWYPEEVSKVMCNLYNKVGQTFYGFMQPPIRIDRRPGRPRNQHNADLCQACRDGECDQGRPVKAVFNYLPPDANARMPHPPITGRPPVMNPQLPVIIRQPPVPHPGQVVMHGPNPSTCAPVAPNHPNAPAFITSPVTLTSGVQPILTYSVVTAPAKEIGPPRLAPVEESTETTEMKGEPTATKAQEPEDTAVKSNDREANPEAAETDVKPAAIAIRPPPESAASKAKSSASPQSKDSKPTPKVATTVNSAAPPKPQSSGGRNSSAPPPQKNTGAPTKPLETEKPANETEVAAAGENTSSKPVVNGYATAARKALPKALPANGIAAI